MERHENAVEDPTNDIVSMHLFVTRQEIGPFNTSTKTIIKLENKLFINYRSDISEEKESRE